MSSQISLKILIPHLSTTKTLQFPSETPISHVIKELKTKLTLPPEVSAEFQIFEPTLKKYLPANRTLGYFDIINGTTLEYRKKMRPLKVKLMDQSIKTVMIDESESVLVLVEGICKRIGIANPEEYSLLTEFATKPDATVKRSNKSNQPEDEHWLNPEAPLPEQNVTESDMLVLKKKFFFSDSNVDRNDPVQLHLMYVQSRDAIISGKHPCTMDEAIQFASLQAQIQFGNHEPDKHRAGFLKLPEFLAKEYVKHKEIEKRILQDHRKLQGLTELNAKFRYVQLCRSLKTYGVTFFLVHEKLEKKNKMEDVLLGITRDSIIRVDADTKEVLKTWPLTQLRRWAASPNRFTLDFGDYESTYYSVQTTEGEQMSQLISGYIDIILKKKKENERPVDDEEMEVEINSNQLASNTSLAFNPFGMKGTKMSSSRGSISSMMSVNSNMSAVSNFRDINSMQGKNAIVNQIVSAQGAMSAALTDLTMEASLPPLGNDAAANAWKAQQIAVQQQTLLGSTITVNSSVCNLLNGNLNAVPAVTSAMGPLAEALKMMAALIPDDKELLLKSGRAYAQSVREVLVQLQMCLANGSDQSRVYDQVKTVAVSTNELLIAAKCATTTDEVERKYLAGAEIVTDNVLKVVNTGRQMDLYFQDVHKKHALSKAVNELRLAATRLYPCLEVVLPVINARVAQDALLDTLVTLQDCMEVVFELLKTVEHKDGKAKLPELEATCALVSESIGAMISQVQNGEQGDETDRAFERLLAASQEMLENTTNGASIVNSARDTTVASTALVKLLKVSEVPQRTEGAQLLADATTKMVANAKLTAKAPADLEKQLALRESLSELIAVASDAVGNNVVASKLAEAARAVSSTSQQIMSVGKIAALTNRNSTTQTALLQATRKMGDANGNLVLAVRQVLVDQDDAAARKNLLVASRAAVKDMEALLGITQSVAVGVYDPQVKAQLETAVEQGRVDNAQLNEALKAMELVLGGGATFEKANDGINALLKKIASLKSRPPTEWGNIDSSIVANAAANVSSKTAKVEASVDLLHSHSSRGDHKNATLGAVELNDDLAQLLKGVQAVCQSISDSTPNRVKIITTLMNNTSKVMDEANKSLAASKIACAPGGQSPANLERLKRQQEMTLQALQALQDSLPGSQAIASTIDVIRDDIERGIKLHPGFQTMDISDATTLLASKGYALQSAATSKDAEEMNKNLGDFADAYKSLISSVASHLQKPENSSDRQLHQTAQENIANSGESSIELLLSLRNNGAEKDSRGITANAILKLGDSLSTLSDNFGSKNPLVQQLEAAERRLDATRASLEVVESSPVTVKEFKEAIDQISTINAEASKSISGLGQAASNTDASVFVNATVLAVDNVSRFINVSAMTAHFIASSGPDSTASAPSILKMEGYIEALQGVQQAVSVLNNTGSTQKEILTAAGAIAKNTAWVCNSCKTASTLVSDPKDVESFLSYAKSVATGTAALVGNIKVLATLPTPGAREACQSTSTTLIDRMNTLNNFAGQPKFVGSASMISEEGRQRIAPVLGQARLVCDTSRRLIRSAKQIAGNTEQVTPQVITAMSKALADGLNKLMARMREAAPGQKETDDTLSKIANGLSLVEAEMIKQESGTMQQNDGLDLDHDLRSLSNAIQNLGSSVTSIKGQIDGNSTAADLPAAIINLGDIFINLVNASIKVAPASALGGSNGVLPLTQRSGESLIESLYAYKNQSDANGKATIEQAFTTFAANLEALRGVVEFNSAPDDVFTECIKNCSNAFTAFETSLVGRVEVSKKVATPEDVNKTGRTLIDITTDIIAKPKNLDALTTPAQKLSSTTVQVISQTQSIMSSVTNKDNRIELVSSVHEVNNSVIRCLENCRASIGKGAEASVRQKLSSSAREISASIARLMQTVRQSCKGFLKCHEVSVKLQEIGEDLKGLAIFAEAGQLDAFDSKVDSFAAHKEPLLDNCKNLVEAVKVIVAASSSASQDELAATAGKIGQLADEIAENVKNTATSIGSRDKVMQKKLIQKSGDALESVDKLMGSATTAFGVLSAGDENDPKVVELRSGAKNVVTNVGEILKVLKLIGDENSKAARAVETALADIDSAVLQLESTDPAQGTALPEEIVEYSKAIAIEAAKLVSLPTNKQNLTAQSIGALTKHVEGLARASKAATEKAPQDQKDRNVKATISTSRAIQQLLMSIQTNIENSTPATKSAVQRDAKAVADSVNGVMDAAGLLVPAGYVDPNDPNVIAERELLSAANMIEAAAKKLASFKPPVQVNAADESLDFSAQIMEAAKAIAAASGALIKSATVSQREILAKGKGGTSREQMYYSDGSWSEGLVSAARAVAVATGELCESANQTVKGLVPREHIIISARNVSAATQRLMLAATTKADPNATSQIRLKAASKAVLSASDSLVKAAEQSAAFQDTDSVAELLSGGLSPTQGKVKEMEAQMSVLKMEKDLEMARNRLAGLRKNKYQA